MRPEAPAAVWQKAETKSDGVVRPHNGGVGFNPYRPQRRRRSDYLLVGSALLITVALVAWAFLG